MTTAADAAASRPAQRRRFIRLLGGGFVAAAVPLAAGCAGGIPEAATAAWTAGGGQSDVRRFMLAHALLAPNPHNRQPWLADLSRPGEIALVCDGERLLPETDPYGRQIVVGCGAFVELAVIAAAERGIRVAVQPFPDGEPAPAQLPGGRVVARLLLTPDAGVARDPLFAQIRRRRTNKTAYDDGRRIGAAQWQSLATAARAPGLVTGAVDEAARIAAVRAITRTAYEIESTTPRTWLESARLFRIGPDAIERHRDGISIPDAMPRLLAAVGLFDPLEVPVRGSANHGRVMDRWAPFETGSGYFWIASDGNGRRAQLAAGRAYVRAQLQATADGIDMHPLSQALQEFDEMREPYAAIHRALGLDPQRTTLQMLTRVGHAKATVGPSPRRGLDALLGA